ncbi:hypothetical protein D8674_013935 [Pyrus ussuriensis x Pyrus communis]|uniref:Uncharacterized protein n=1 Tax=Pyrus ussuriensis x Pyrus communis TaxID=2448454 RepID=A0A5N5GR32_9ROSA|nr:hypothetical protein D8674_013935 [Pyrus ussuriensis x Pyrus communis]
MVLSWLTSSLFPPIMHVVVKCVSAAKAWILFNFLANFSIFVVVILTLLIFFDKINTLSNQLALSSSLMFDANLIAMIMNNVGPFAETRHLTFTLSGDTPIPSMTSMAANRGHRVHVPASFACGRGCAGVPPCGGFALRPNGNNVGPPRPNGNVVGVLDAGPSFVNRPPLKCQICCRNGYSAIDCYNRINTSYKSRVPSAHLTTLTAQSHRAG